MPKKHQDFHFKLLLGNHCMDSKMPKILKWRAMHVLYHIISRTFSTSTWSYSHLKRVPVVVRWKWPLEWVPSWQMARKFPMEKAWKWRISSQLCLFVQVSKVESMHRICSKRFPCFRCASGCFEGWFPIEKAPAAWKCVKYKQMIQ